MRDFDGSIKSEKNSDIIFSKNGNANYLGRCQAYPSLKVGRVFYSADFGPVLTNC